MNQYIANAQTVFLFFAIIIITFILAYLVNRVFKRIIRRSTEEMRNDPTNYIFLRHAIIAMIYLIGFGIAIYVVPSLRTLARSLLAGAGIFAVAVGFASQHALSNIISGFFIVLFKPFRVNDRLVVKGLTGFVEDITLRHTVIRDFENRRILIPNTVISDEVIINSDFIEDKVRRRIDINISFDSDIALAKKIMKEEVEKHPLHLDARTPEQIEEGVPEVVVRLLSIGEYSIKLRAWTWAKNAKESFILNCDLLEAIKKRFDEEGIKIPYPHRVVKNE